MTFLARALAPRLGAACWTLATLCATTAGAQTIAPAAEVAPPQAPEAVAAPTIVPTPASFMIAAFDVTGVSKLPAGEVERIIYPFLGPDRTQDDVEKARKAVQDAYAGHGFEAVVVEVPPQRAEIFAQGLIEIRVNEAPVGAIQVTGAKHHSSKDVLAAVPSLVPGQPVDFKALQSELADANHYPDRQVSPSFKAGKLPGTIDVNLKVKDSLPLHGSVELNNDNSPNTSALRATASLKYSNLWGAGHTLSLSVIGAPQRRSDSMVYSGSYAAPLFGTPWTLVAYGYKSNSNIAALGGSSVLGNGYQFGARAIYALSGEKANHSFSFGLDFKDFKQDVSVGGVNVSKAPIRYVPIVLGYGFSQNGDKTALELNLNATLGLRVFKITRCIDPTAVVCQPEDQFTNKDFDSAENFAHINFDATLTRAFAGDWVIAAKAAGQYADGHLVTNEQFAAGGQSTVRGYYQSEIVGDRGATASLEFRTPSIATALASFVDELRFYTFAEAGITSVINPLPDQISRYTIGTYGGGARLKLFGHVSGEFNIGIPVRDGPTSRRGDPRITFTAKGEF